MPKKLQNSPDAEQAQRAPVGDAIGVLGDFELRRVLGRGGMGTVYEAWQQSLQRTVALKVLSQAVSSSPNAVARFQREAQAAAKLHHTHIVPIFALGEDDGTYFYAMELVEGESLNAIIGSKRASQEADTATVTLDETVPLAQIRDSTTPSDTRVAQTAADRSAAGLGLSESDGSGPPVSGSTVVRPAREDFINIASHLADVADALAFAHRHGVVHRDIKPHNLLLGDDGRLRISDFGLARLAEQPGVTVTGELIGSPLYMSPEQLSGEAGKVDHTTDIYSLGATLYEWLTLQPPYPGETRERVISAILTREPPPPRLHNPQIPVDLETICLKAMEREPKRRYQSAAELRDDLHRFLERRPIQATRAGVLLRTGRFVYRHQVASVAALALVVALVLGWALLWQRGEVAAQSEAVAELQEEREQILDVLSVLPLEVTAPLRAAGAVQGLLDQNQLGLSVAGLGAMQAGGAPGVGTPAAIAVRAVRQFYDTVVAADLSPVISDSSDEASQLLRDAREFWRDQPQRAWQRLDSYIALRKDSIHALQMRAALSARLGRFEEMLEDAQRMVAIDGRSAPALIWRGLAHLMLDHTQDAVDDLTRATQLDPSSPWAKIARGLALIRQGRAGGAILEFEDALRVMPSSIVATLGRASAYSAFGKHERARTDADQVLEQNPDDVDALTIHGDCSTALGDLATAAADFNRAFNLVGRNNSALALRIASVLAQQQLLKRETADPAEQPGSAAETRTSAPTDGSTDVWRNRWSEYLSERPTEGHRERSGGLSRPHARATPRSVFRLLPSP